MAKVYFDAATKGNPGVSACAVVIVTDSARYHFEKDLGEMENNHLAEWEALIFAMACAQDLQLDTLLLHTDSKVIADSVEANYVKNKAFQPYMASYHTYMPHFDLVFIKWVARNQNKEANHYAKQALHRYYGY